MVHVALTIAGSDPSGGAGLQADLKTFHAFGVYGASVVTLITVQNTVSVTKVDVLPESLVEAQLDSVLVDLDVRAAKTGALGSAEIASMVAYRFAENRIPLVVDPVMVSKHGAALVDARTSDAIRTKLLPACFLVTPNAPEAAVLAGREVRTIADAIDAAKAIADLGAQNVLVKGGHLEDERARDVLFASGDVHLLDAVRLVTTAGHGTGCTLSAAITAGLADGAGLLDAVTTAKAWLGRALGSAPSIGHGISPVNHLERVR